MSDGAEHGPVAATRGSDGAETRQTERQQEEAQEARRWWLQERVTAWFDVALAVLAFVMLALILIEFTQPLEDPWADRFSDAQLAIWSVFVLAFAIELTLAPSKRRYLRENWLVALSLALPLLRIFRALRAVRILRTTRVVRGLSLARVAGALKRSTGVAREFARTSRFAYLLILTVLVTVTAAGAVFYFERDAQDATIRSVGDALWWSSTVITTVNAPQEAVTFEGRLVALALRLFGIAIIGYFTARFAAFLLASPEAPDEPEGQRADADATSPSGRDDEIRALRDEVRRLADLVEEPRQRSR